MSKQATLALPRQIFHTKRTEEITFYFSKFFQLILAQFLDCFIASRAPFLLPHLLLTEKKKKRGAKKKPNSIQNKPIQIRARKTLLP